MCYQSLALSGFQILDIQIGVYTEMKGHDLSF